MRCPKCQYLGFDGQERCRNCGYDLSLSQTLPPAEAQGGDAHPAVIRATGGSAGAQTPAPDEADLLLRAEPTARERARAAIQKRQAASRAPGADPFDLPLFAEAAEPRAPEPRPFVSVSPTPRPPLAVRRATVEAPHARAAVAPAPASLETVIDEAPMHVADPGEGPARFDADALSLSLAAEPQAAPDRSSLPTSASTRAPRLALDRPEPEPTADREARVDADASGAPDRAAPLRARIIAGLVDGAILGAIDLAVIAFTLQLTGLTWREIGRLPLAPLLAFLALLATGYLAMFTVLAGQTAGKMAAGIRVVEPGGRPVRFGHAVVRAAIQVITTPLLGIGFLPALLASDRRALYDRLADTDVICND
jgi:uncharacterized RDD family membrane protein YckC